MTIIASHKTKNENSPNSCIPALQISINVVVMYIHIINSIKSSSVDIRPIVGHVNITKHQLYN